MTHSPAIVEKALALAEEGASSWKIAAELGVPSSTIRGWVRGDVPKRWRGKRHPHGSACEQCAHPVHDFDALPQAAYAYLLGLYLGDGCLSKCARKVFRLRIFLDAKYPGIVAECAAGMRGVLPQSVVNTRHQGAKSDAYEVSSCSRQWPCLFPQHGPGRKHERLILLTAWQQTICESEPRALLRGLIHSDGCRSINTIHSRDRTYSYPRYLFSNHSADIHRIFTDHLDLLGINWRPMNWRTTSVARRADVALMDSFIGPKR